MGGPAGSGCLGRFQLCLPAVCGNPVSQEPRIGKVNSLALGLKATSRAGEGLSQGSRGGAPVEPCSATAQGGLLSRVRGSIRTPPLIRGALCVLGGMEWVCISVRSRICGLTIESSVRLFSSAVEPSEGSSFEEVRKTYPEDLQRSFACQQGVGEVC